MASPLAVEARAVGKSYGLRTAVRDIDLAVRPGERVALLGPNGAGKTTLLKLLSTLVRPTRGNVRIYGLDAVRYSQAARRRLGFVGHRPYLYEDLTARENLEFYAKLYSVGSPTDRYLPLLEAAGLAQVADLRVGAFSRGMQQRLAIVRALLHAPDLLLLDEPDTGLDQDGIRFLDSLICSTDHARTIVFTTHNLDLAARLAGRAVVLRGGRLVHDSPLAGRDRPPLEHVFRELAGTRS